LASHFDGSPGGRPGDFRIVRQGGVSDDLHPLKAASIIYLNERERFGIATGSDPPLNEHVIDGLGGGKQSLDGGPLHGREEETERKAEGRRLAIA
jgi:hypothetical protein